MFCPTWHPATNNHPAKCCLLSATLYLRTQMWSGRRARRVNSLAWRWGTHRVGIIDGEAVVESVVDVLLEIPHARQIRATNPADELNPMRTDYPHKSGVVLHLACPTSTVRSHAAY